MENKKQNEMLAKNQQQNENFHFVHFAVSYPFILFILLFLFLHFVYFAVYFHFVYFVYFAFYCHPDLRSSKISLAKKEMVLQSDVHFQTEIRVR